MTAYNLAVVIGAFALLPLVRRVRPAWLALAGLVIFLVASVVCAVSGSLETLVAGRVAQGLGAAFLLGVSLPLLVVLSGDRRRAVALWVGAGTIGTAVGPASAACSPRPSTGVRSSPSRRPGGGGYRGSALPGRS